MKVNNHTITNDFFKLDLLKGATLVGLFDFPMINPTNLNLQMIEALPINYAKSCKNPNNYVLHFYVDDYQFERMYNTPSKYLNMLKNFKYIIAPDFSLYLDMPRAMQIWNCYRNRALTYYYQTNGIEVIPNVSWSDEFSFSYCFDGLPKNSTLAVSSVGCMKNPKALLNFCKGFEAMMDSLQPRQVIVFGQLPESLKKYKNIKIINTFYNKFEKFNQGGI